MVFFVPISSAFWVLRPHVDYASYHVWPAFSPAKSKTRQEVLDFLCLDGHQITLLAAHDNMMTAFLVALDVFKEQWPLYGSMVVCLGINLGSELVCFLVKTSWSWKKTTLEIFRELVEVVGITVLVLNLFWSIFATRLETAEMDGRKVRVLMNDEARGSCQRLFDGSRRAAVYISLEVAAVLIPFGDEIAWRRYLNTFF